MSLADMKTVLAMAESERCAVGAFNVFNLEFIEGVVEAAEEAGAPVILSLGELHLRYVSFELITSAMLMAAERASVPVVLHLDHGHSVATVIRAIQGGFTSVMIDGSSLPFAENVALTKKVAEIAHAADVSVEGELGCVGDEDETTEVMDEQFFTDPEEACKFVAETSVDALAVSIGNVHGLYRGRPHLDFGRLYKIHEHVPVPLVLHGGSGISEQDFQRLIQGGVRKINIFTDISLRAVEGIRNNLCDSPSSKGIVQVLSALRQAAREAAREKILLFWTARRTG